jgi:putative flippase GtrA
MLTQDHPTLSGLPSPIVPSAIWTTPTPRPYAVVTYLAVGFCNTLFGYGCFALFTALLSPLLAYGYVVASLLANLLGISFAFFGYKWFVFKTQGNYLREWIRCVGVYAASMILSAALLPLLVGVLRRRPGHDQSAPYIAGAIVLIISVVCGFFGHRHISFAEGTRAGRLAGGKFPS